MVNKYYYVVFNKNLLEIYWKFGVRLFLCESDAF